MRIGMLVRCPWGGCNVLETQTAVDPRTAEMQYGERSFDVRKKGFFWITKHIREGMDTYQVINSGREIIGGNDLAVNITENTDQKPKRKLGFQRNQRQSRFNAR